MIHLTADPPILDTSKTLSPAKYTPSCPGLPHRASSYKSGISRSPSALDTASPAPETHGTKELSAPRPSPSLTLIPDV